MIDSAALKEILGGIVQYHDVHRDKDCNGEIYLELIITLTDTRTVAGSARSAVYNLK